MSDSLPGRRAVAPGSRGLLVALACCLLLLFARPAVAADRLRFEANFGQFESQVRYLARGRSYALFLTRTGATLALQRARQASSISNGPKAGDEDQPLVVGMKVRGAAPVEPRGLAQLPGQSNYFTGSNPASWRSGVKSYARVRYESVLPGVDVEYYGTEGRELEYDFVLAAGVEIGSVVSEFEGVSGIDLAADGGARLRLPDGSELVKRAPVAYQLRDGKRLPVRVSYELRAGGLGFRVEGHDPCLPLIIDPVLTYASYFGGSSFDEAQGIATDAAGNTYFVGYTASTLFPTSSPAQPTHGGGAYDAFVVKLDPSGAGIVYSTYLGGSGADIAYAVATDALGNAYVAGLTMSPNFPVVSAIQTSPGGGQDAFVTKLNANGSALAYSTYLGGSLDDYAKGIAVSGAGAAYLVGTTFSANFPKVQPLQASLKGTQDAFASQIAPAGSALVYSTYLGGSDAEYGNSIALDSSGSAYLVGSTTSANFPLANARQLAHAGGGSDAFVSKLNATGAAFVFSTYLGGSAADQALGVSVSLGTAFVVGSTLSTDFPLAFPSQPDPGGDNHSDAFITRFDQSGTAFVYSTYLGGTGNDSAAAVASDSAGNAYVVGQTDSVDLPLVQPIAGQESYWGTIDAFVTAVVPSGVRFAYTTYLGGTGEDRGTAIAVGNGLTYVLGSTRSAGLPTVKPILASLVGAQDAFIAKLPSIDAVAAPGSGAAWLGLLAAVLFGIALFLLSGRRPTRYRSAR
jgi:hypothetical protein